jgi:cell wall-associated NlpC family hydrolase
MLRAVLRCPALIAAVCAALLLPLAGTAVAEDLTAGPAPTELRITTPSSVPAGSHADVWVRLVAPGDGGEAVVPGQTVLVQRQLSSGWSQVASFTTDADGLAHGPVTVGSTSRYRAYYRGDATHASATSREVVITATTLGDRALAEAKRHRGKTYRYGAAGPDHFDCSGLTMYVYGRLGKKLPHGSSAQSSATQRIANSAKRPGDLIFTYHGDSIGHVGIYAGGAQMWASVQAGDVVRLQSFEGRTYRVGRVG